MFGGHFKIPIKAQIVLQTFLAFLNRFVIGENKEEEEKKNNLLGKQGK